MCEFYLFLVIFISSSNHAKTVQKFTIRPARLLIGRPVSPDSPSLGMGDERRNAPDPSKSLESSDTRSREVSIAELSEDVFVGDTSKAVEVSNEYFVRLWINFAVDLNFRKFFFNPRNWVSEKFHHYVMLENLLKIIKTQRQHVELVCMQEDVVDVCFFFTVKFYSFVLTESIWNGWFWFRYTVCVFVIFSAFYFLVWNACFW